MATERTESELIEAAREGDESAFQHLFGLHDAALRRYARKWLPPAVRRKVSASDVLQEAHIVVLERIADFEDRGSNAFRNWMLKILELKVRAYVRRYAGTAKRDVAREITRAGRPGMAEIRSTVPSPSEVAVASELAAIAAQAMRYIPAHYREVLTLAREKQLTLREIARQMGHSREAIKKRYGRALARFTSEFERLRNESHVH